MKMKWGVILLSVYIVYANKVEYTLREQQQDHFEVAIRSFQENDINKSIRIFEFLASTIQSTSFDHSESRHFHDV